MGNNGNGNGKVKRIMLVEDSSLMRTVIKKIVESVDEFKVVAEAPNGKVALDLLSKANPDLIILDLEMPVMNGLDFLRNARLRTRAKVMVLSSVAQAGSGNALEARKLGAAAVLGKPSGAVSLDLEQKRGHHIVQIMKSLLRV